jgi:hypothetical protein
MAQHPADTRWLVASPEGNKGPFDEAQMQAMVDDRSLRGDMYIWRDGWDNWKLVRETGDFRPSAAAKTPARATVAESAVDGSGQAPAPAPARDETLREPTAVPNEVAAAAAAPVVALTIPDAQNQDDYLDSIFVAQLEKSWERHRRRQRSQEVDEVLVGGVITGCLDSGYSLIDLDSDGRNHNLRFEDMASGNRVIFRMQHLAESLLTAKVLGHEAMVQVGYGERVKDFGRVWKAVKQEMRGGYVRQADPGIITVDGDISSQYIYVEVGLIWDLNDYLDGDNTYKVQYPKLSRDIGGTLHALRKYLHGRLS